LQPPTEHGKYILTAAKSNTLHLISKRINCQALPKFLQL
jgi:hypothetical protein